jgi:hypothetical protein
MNGAEPGGSGGRALHTLGLMGIVSGGTAKLV